MHKNNIIGISSNCQADYLYDYFAPKQFRGKELSIRLINFYLNLSFRFRNMRLFHSLGYLAKILDVNKNYLCSILKQLVNAGILQKRRTSNMKTPEYFLSNAFRQPEVRYALSSIFSCLKGLSLSLLFLSGGRGAEDNIKRLSDQYNGGDLNLYYKNYEDIINGVFKDAQKFKKNKRFGKVKSIIYEIWDEVPQKRPEADPVFQIFEKLESAVLADHSFYVHKIWGHIPFYSPRREPVRNKKTSRSVYEADEVIKKAEEQRKKLEAEEHSDEAARKYAECMAKLKRLGLM